MATTTPNFGWPVPTSTDLVKDGATAIEGLGDAIDASLLDLKGGTTGQILSKASNTDMDYTWITNDVGDITAVTAGTGISGGGTSGAVTVTNSMATAIDAKGDLVVGTAADAFARLGVGANGTILTADSAEATGLKWTTPSAGGKVLQVVYATNTTAKTISSTSYTDTNLTATITPTSSSSKILILINQIFYFERTASGGDQGVGIQIVRGATSVYDTGPNVWGFFAGGSVSSIQLGHVGALTYLDSPATTSATTYKTQAKNLRATGASYYQDGGVPSAITLIEIGA